MRYREFGKTGWRVSEIGFGGARIGGLLAQDGGRTTSLRTLEAAFDAGINFYDTADIYSQGESEILIGKAFRKKRDKVIVATKGGYCLPGRKKLIQLIQAASEAHSSGDRAAPQHDSSSSGGYDFTGFLARPFEKSRGGVVAATAVRPYRSVPDPQPASGGAPRHTAPGCVGVARAFEGGRENP